MLGTEQNEEVSKSNSDTGYDSSLRENASISKENTSSTIENSPDSAPTETISQIIDGTTQSNTNQAVNRQNEDVVIHLSDTPDSTTEIVSQIVSEVLQAVEQKIIEFEARKTDVTPDE